MRVLFFFQQRKPEARKCFIAGNWWTGPYIIITIIIYKGSSSCRQAIINMIRRGRVCVKVKVVDDFQVLVTYNFNTLIKQLKVAMVVCITIFTSIQHKETLTKMSLDLNDSTKSWLTTVKVWWMIWFDLRTWWFQSICRKPSSSFSRNVFYHRTTGCWLYLESHILIWLIVSFNLFFYIVYDHVDRIN